MRDARDRSDKPQRRFRVRGTLLSEIYSSPSGAFEVHGFLSVEKDRLVFSRRDKAAWMRKLVVPFARVTESRVEDGRIHVEWRTDDGVISALDLALGSAEDARRFAESASALLASLQRNRHGSSGNSMRHT